MNSEKYVRWGGAAVALTGAGMGYAYQNIAVAQTANPVSRTASPANAPVPETPAVKDAAAMQTAFAQVARVVEPAVVTITSPERAVRRVRMNSIPGMPDEGFPDFGGDPFEEFFRRFGAPRLSPNSASPEQQMAQDRFRPVQEGRGGLGSGFIYDKSGLIITNAHVVGNAKTVSVALVDGREFKNAQVLGRDPIADIAVVKISGQNLPTVLGDSSRVNVGDWAIAVGNPFGLSNTMTVGVISAKAREVPLSVRNPGDYFQTDASINPGNSGGPLVNIFGQVVGVNNAIYSPTGGNVGIGFAIPINAARNVADQLAKTGKVRRGQLGIGIGEIGENAQAFGLPVGTKGVLVSNVQPNGAAAKAGIRVGDVITAFNGEATLRPAELQRKVSMGTGGQTATITVLRDGKTINLTARLDELKLDATPTPDAPDDNVTPESGEPAAPGLGIRLAPLDAAMRQRAGVEASVQGVVIAAVAQDSPAANAGIRPGDIVSRVGQTPVNTPEEMRSAVKRVLDSQTSGKKVALFVNRRGGDSGYIVVSLNN